jgi:hypothetical protein
MSDDTNNVLRAVALAELMLKQEADVAAAEVALAEAKAKHRRTEQEDLPELMQELGLLEFKLLDGTKIIFDPDVQCGIKVENRAPAALWLIEHGFGGIIKTQLTIGFGRGEREKALEAAEKIEAQTGFACGFEETVHPSTLKSFVKEQREKGTNFPPSIDVHPFNRAKVKRPKQ